MKSTNLSKFFLIALLGFSISVMSCKKEEIKPEPEVQNPISSFTYNIVGNFAPAEVTFNSTSENASSYSWDFGDGKSGYGSSESHIFTEGGSYSVELTAKNSDGTIDRKTIIVNIKDKPSKIKITSFTLTKTSFVDNSGSSWDSNSAPDFMFKIKNHNTSEILFESSYYSDIAPSNLPITFTQGLPLVSHDLSQEIAFLIYDHDNIGSDDYIGGYYFAFVDFIPQDGSPYPTTLYLSNGTNPTQYQLEVDWME